MTPEAFCYWLQGWFELNSTIDHRKGATPETLEMIKKHLQSVFTNTIMNPGLTINPNKPFDIRDYYKIPPVTCDVEPQGWKSGAIC